MELKFQVHGRVEKPVAEVFDAVYDPKKLSGYFTTGGASGLLDEGTTVTWDFADFPGAFPVRVRQVERDRLIVLEWDAGENDETTLVRLEFEPLDEASTMVRISEGTWPATQGNLDRSYGNCMGWTQMIAALKVYAEHGINLREGYFK
ncbi:MAG TPA: SRPBCC domain-containing protein [Actinomycetota bacterium]|nr:SRPBCC domain-containing protein [Actinomycetota bacterium]